MNIKYCGPARDYSGYGEANRHDIGSLVSAGIEVVTQIPVYSMEISDYGLLGELAVSRENKKLTYDIKILHTTPNVYPQFIEPGKYHIGRVFWETDKIPDDFAKNLQYLNEIWTGSEFNAAAIRKAGIDKPIHIMPEAIDTDLPVIAPYEVQNEDTYRFYSIFEWTERKNPIALLEAYWQEFEHTQGVSLTIKTYVDNFTPQKEREIENNLRLIKKRMALKNYAPVYVFPWLMDRHQVYRLHASMNCFVSSHRGEGWGIPQMEALVMGNPVISTACGGIHEYLTDMTDAVLVPYKLIPLTENTRNRQWYTTDQQWADVDILALKKALRWVFDHKEEAKAMGITGKKTVENLFSMEVVGLKMRERLETIARAQGFAV